MADTPNAIPWYKSNVLRGLLVVVLTHTLVHYHIVSQFTPDDIGSFVDELMSLLGYAGAGLAAYARVKTPMPAVTLTKAKADSLNTPGDANVKP
jgi:hypothetical protein